MIRFFLGVILGIYIALYGVDGFMNKVTELYNETKVKIHSNTTSN